MPSPWTLSPPAARFSGSEPGAAALRSQYNPPGLAPTRMLTWLCSVLPRSACAPSPTQKHGKNTEVCAPVSVRGAARLRGSSALTQRRRSRRPDYARSREVRWTGDAVAEDRPRPLGTHQFSAACVFVGASTACWLRMVFSIATRVRAGPRHTLARLNGVQGLVRTCVNYQHTFEVSSR